MVIKTNSSTSFLHNIFPEGFAGEVMQLILQTWNNDLNLQENVRHETCITALFRDALINAYEEDGRNWFITLEDPITDPDTGQEQGRNDLRFYPPVHRGQKVFFTVECKRLHVTTASGFSSLIPEYVNEGMIRFITGVYSQNHSKGGMIGYVMDANITEAMRKIKNKIEMNSNCLQLLPQQGTEIPSSVLKDYPYSADTYHTRTSGEFVIHHILLVTHRN